MDRKLNLLDFYFNSFLSDLRPQKWKDKLQESGSVEIYIGEYITGPEFKLPVFNDKTNYFDLILIENQKVIIHQFTDGTCSIKLNDKVKQDFIIYSPNELFELIQCCENLNSKEDINPSVFSSLSFIIPTIGQPMIVDLQKAITSLHREELEILCRFLDGKVVMNNLSPLPNLKSLIAIANKLYNPNTSRQIGQFPILWSNCAYSNCNFDKDQIHLSTSIGMIPRNEHSISGTIDWLNEKSNDVMSIFIKAVQEKTYWDIENNNPVHPLEVQKKRIKRRQV